MVPKKFNVSIDLYKAKFNVIFDQSVSSALVNFGIFNEYAEGFSSNVEAENYADSADALFFTYHKKGWIILILPFDTTPNQIAHECFHLTKFIMDKKGIILCDESEEAFAYLLDHLVKIVFEFHTKFKQNEKSSKKHV